MELSEAHPPDPVYVRHRWISPNRIAWAKRADELLTQCGAVVGDRAYTTMYRAKWRARSLRETLIALGLRQGWELRQHTEHGPDGWTWALELIPDRPGR